MSALSRGAEHELLLVLAAEDGAGGVGMGTPSG